MAVPEEHRVVSRYAAVHKAASGPGDDRPSADQILKDERMEGKLIGKTIFITGCSSSIGVETAKTLFLTGARIYVTARDLAKARAALGDIIESGRVVLLPLELGSFDSVRACASKFLASNDTLNILICNAGLLKPALLAAASSELQSRVIMLSSMGHRFGSVNFDNVNLDWAYNGLAAYHSSKTANVWTANEIDRRYGGQGDRGWSVHPGSVPTELARHISAEQLAAMSGIEEISRTLESVEQGAATTIWAAVASELEGRGGRYLEDCQVAEAWDPEGSMFSPGYASHAYDEEQASRLWELSLHLVAEGAVDCDATKSPVVLTAVSPASGGFGAYGAANAHGYSYSALSSSVDSESDRRSCTACNPANQARRDSIPRIRDNLASPPPKVHRNDLVPYSGLSSGLGLTFPRKAMQKPSTHGSDVKPHQPAPCHAKGHQTAAARPRLYRDSRRPKGHARQQSEGEARPAPRSSIDSTRSRTSHQAPSVIVKEPTPAYSSSRKSIHRGRGLWSCFGR
ncbi:oxidoreductase [Paramyrothecium foliicola]|nr:oxidoreductase [Paramyrothecium foliicola]